MNIIPKLTVALSLMVGAIMATSCADDIETGINTDPTGNAISFTPAVGHSTRATETTIKNLGNFAVVARGMHHDGQLYNTYLIGSSTSGDIARLESLDNKETPTKGTWTLDHNVYWPATLNKVLFYAYTTLQDTDGDVTNVLGTGPTFGFDGNNPYIDNFTPLKATEPENGIQADGKGQKDLLVAYNAQEKNKSETNVNLNFKHALTQVSIKAKQDGKLSTDNRIVKIKGAWIVNAAQSGKLTATADKTGTGEDTKYTYKDSWTSTGNEAYGSVWKEAIKLGTTPTDILREMSLMLIPRNLSGWDYEKDNTNSKKGAYILLLCRVELEHDGDTHAGVDLSDIGTENGKHYHQLFPVNKTEYDATEYGFACVPLSSAWNTEGIGKHYTYNLNICGNGTGAGKYPPAAEAAAFKTSLVPESFGITVILNNYNDTGKNPGDNVLDDPIQFTVTVGKWEQTGGNINL